MLKLLIALLCTIYYQGNIPAFADEVATAPSTELPAKANKTEESAQQTAHEESNGYQPLSSKEAIAFVKDLIKKGMAAANEKNPGEAFGKLLESNFETKEISLLVLGRIARDMNEAQIEEFHQLYKKRLIQIYSDPKKVKAFRNTTPTISNRAKLQIDNTVLVSSTFQNKDDPGEEPTKVIWKVVKRNGKLFIHDVIFEGISKLISERSEYLSVFNQHGSNPEKFLDYLKSVVTKSPEETAAKDTPER